ncbi:hypothetical protein C2G38_2168924 [Gigaspora rosea]|uniref:Uncharacterized protein n=1 Tax=Gigaspora rosea TaxID=44941 RepID=A0A397VP31_9GLOM|nr:hypothetical protein C2G38_2168924 [Gigaspora rosea]
MSEIKQCGECQTTESSKFRALKHEKWREAEINKLAKQVITVKEKAVCEEEASPKIELSEAIKMIAKILYEREHVRHEEPIYSFNEMRQLFQEIQSCTNNEGINTMANLGITTTSRAVNRKKRRKSNAHGEYVERALLKYSENALVLNIDDYYNIHIPQQPNTINTSRAIHMATIITNSWLILAITRIGAIIPKIVDNELIARHLDKRFIVNLGISYNDRMQNSRKVCSDDELIERLMVHNYNDRLAEKQSDQHVRNAILFDFIENELKGVSGYMKALQIVYNQEVMQEYLSSHAIPIIADWPGQFYIRKAIARQLLTNDETIPQFVTSFLPMMGPLHVSLNTRKLIFDQNLILFNDAYKGTFEKQRDLDSVKYPYPPKKLDILSQKCAKWLLDIFMKIYQARHECPLIVNSSESINTYKLSSLGYEVTDCHLPRGFVTSKRLNTYLHDKVKENVDAFMVSLTKKSTKKEPIEKDSSKRAENDSNYADEMAVKRIKWDKKKKRKRSNENEEEEGIEDEEKATKNQKRQKKDEKEKNEDTVKETKQEKF